METLVWMRGRDLPLAGLAERLLCPLCGSRKIEVLYNVPTLPNASALRIGKL